MSEETLNQMRALVEADRTATEKHVRARVHEHLTFMACTEQKMAEEAAAAGRFTSATAHEHAAKMLAAAARVWA